MIRKIALTYIFRGMLCGFVQESWAANVELHDGYFERKICHEHELTTHRRLQLLSEKRRANYEMR